MNRTCLRQFTALLLLVVFAGGGIGSEQLDALLFAAGHDSSPIGVNHLDPPGGCGAHTEHCVLARAAAVRPLGTVAPIRVQLFAPATLSASCRWQIRAASVDPNSLHTARPPPAAS
jgi:hypothetical protein